MGREKKHGKNSKKGKNKGHDDNGNRMRVILDKGHFIEGELITGRVELEVQTPVMAHELMIKFQGYEKAAWEEEVTHTEDDRTWSEWEEHEGDKDFFKEKVTLFQCAGQGFAPGTWIYPFQLTLPMGLPGSFYQKGGENSASVKDLKGKVRYKIKAKLSGYKDMQAKTEVMVFERVDHAVTPEAKMKEGQVCCLCCIPRGKVTLTARFDKNAYIAGETAQILVDCRNESGVNIDDTVCKLMCTITLEDEHGYGSYHDVSTICESKFPGCESGKTFENLYCPLPIPMGIQPSSEAKYVECKYHIDIEAQVPWAPDIEIHLPITLYAPLAGYDVPSFAAAPPPQMLHQPTTPVDMYAAAPPSQQEMVSQPAGYPQYPGGGHV
ncbi:hypothetical protein CYMTET_45138 [Cymbomonas tetramitiformis]|uniref:Arrestin C-terminal-like domain-containing protein n=1 Tax=Cymbomonas tetramitiformis TaxID=36881 RepID=A0AAE0BYT5_9CHLO|nr:hypothetical protein CYMTET_45138 [Cymbomonas tetramitiformis]